MSPKKPPVPSHPKLRGEWAELQFMARCAGLGFRIAKPISDCYRWDLIVEHDLGFHRVQVKSTTVRQRSGYVCIYHSSADFKVYTPDDVDFLAAYIVPEDVWFIIPASVIHTQNLILDPSGDNPRHKYGPYREAWHLLREPGRFNINACADVAWVDPGTVEQALGPAEVGP